MKLELEPEFDKAYPGMIQSEVHITTRAGATLFARSRKVKGDEDHPLSDEEIKEKFVWLSHNRLDRKQAQTVIDEVWSMESHSSMYDFMTSLHAMTT